MAIDARPPEAEGHEIVLNMGPQHPSTHGVFRLVVTLDGETVVEAVPIIGYLHRGTEKLAESRPYLQIIPLTDRLDYLSGMAMNLGYVLAVEGVAGIEVPERAEYLRVIMAELARLASHLVALGSFAADLGTWFTPLIYMFRERERILDMFEMACGQRMTPNYMRFGGVSKDIPPEFVPALRSFIRDMPAHFDEYESLLTTNEIIQARTRGVGILPADIAVGYSISGPALRGSGVPFDVRRAAPYCIYERFDFDIPIGKSGDVFDRYLVRVAEMRQSLRILAQAVEQLPPGRVQNKQSPAFRPRKGEYYSRIEASRGELGCYVVSDGTISPWRCKIRSPSFVNLGVLRELVIGWKVADVVAILGSLDIVLGEVDR
ncbi:MAG: NADH-quinone oxidoreductase subunit D [Chloroflexi bacterium]|nr:NADH-quinone oxidoreductase subunit D [Chloroflexota bacterium]